MRRDSKNERPKHFNFSQVVTLIIFLLPLSLLPHYKNTPLIFVGLFNLLWLGSYGGSVIGVANVIHVTWLCACSLKTNGSAAPSSQSPMRGKCWPCSTSLLLLRNVHQTGGPKIKLSPLPHLEWQQQMFLGSEAPSPHTGQMENWCATYKCQQQKNVALR